MAPLLTALLVLAAGGFFAVTLARRLRPLAAMRRDERLDRPGRPLYLGMVRDVTEAARAGVEAAEHHPERDPARDEERRRGRMARRGDGDESGDPPAHDAPP